MVGGVVAPNVDPEWIGRLVDWLIAFGSGPRGFLALAMVLLTVAIIFCAPTMFKAYLAYRIDVKKFISEHKHLDLKVAERLEALREPKKRDEDDNDHD